MRQKLHDFSRFTSFGRKLVVRCAQSLLTRGLQKGYQIEKQAQKYFCDSVTEIRIAA